MRLTVFLLTTALVHVFAKSTAQRVSLTGNNLTLKQVFTAIKKQTGYVVFSSKEILFGKKTVSVTARDMPLRDFLDTLFKDQPFRFTIQDKTIFISKKPAMKSSAPPHTAPVQLEKMAPVPITGIVTNLAGKPLEGASIRIKGSKRGTMTDANGRFVLAIEKGQIIVVSFTGYEEKEYTITDTQNIVVSLVPGHSKLDEVQIIAYGQTSGRLSTGNVSSVKAKDIERSPVSNPLLAIAGRIPGVFITQTTGYAGTGVQVQVQGRNSITSGTVPFYVVDGVPIVQSMLTPLSSIQGSSDAPAGAGMSNPLAFINPQDIESIDVLKDADATAIYGSRAANGAILITTKKGRPGKTAISLNMQQGFGEVSKKIKTLNTQQYLQMRKDAYASQGLTVPTPGSVPLSTNYDLTVWDQNRYTDWQDVLIGGTAGYFDVQASVSGGNANTQVLVGANYHRETTVMPGDLSDKRGSVHFNMTHSSANQRFRISFGGNYLADKNLLPGVDLTSAALKLAPNAPALYDSAGNLNWATLPNGGAETWINPVRSALRKYNVTTANLIGNTELSYRIWNTLTLRSTFGYTRLALDETLTTPQAFYPPSTTANNRGAVYSNKKTDSWIIEPQLTYQLNRHYGKFDFLLGTTFQKNTFYLQSLSTSGYSNDGQLQNITAATSVIAISATDETYNYNALFGRLGYNFQDKYLLNLSARRDGSSRFGSENLFNNFYGVGAAWVFTRENWWSNKLSWLSFGKLKASYGTTGNDQIGNYSFMSLYRTVGVPQPYGGGTTLRTNSLSNPYLQWEETRKLNIGADLGFLSDRILVNLNYFRNRSSNQLLGYNLPIITGFNSINLNFDALVQNTGIELAIHTENIKGRNFSWSSSINLTSPRNELVAFPGLATSSYATTLVIGEPLSISKVFRYAGVNGQTGRYNFEAPDKSLVEIPVISRDETMIIDRTPRFYGGLQNSISYNGFTLDFLFQFTKQEGYDETRFGFSTPGLYSSTGSTGNQPVRVLDYWKQEGDIAAYQRLNPGVAALTNIFTYANSNYSSATWTDASYIRLKNLSFSYSLPAGVLEKINLQQTRLYVQAQNLLTFTSYKGLDPESQSSSSLPPLRIVTFGIQVSL